MFTYVTLQGELVEEETKKLIQGFEAKFDYAVDVALSAWGPVVLEPANLNSREKLMAVLRKQPDRIRELATHPA